MEQAQKDYRKTVLTPQTEFPMRAGLPEREPVRLKKWQEAGLYLKAVEIRSKSKAFILHDGPPYANGNIHMGHVLDKVLKDMIVRYKHLSGFKAPYVPGWDCHGLPIEQQVLKELGPKIHDMAPIEVRRLCHAYAQKFVDIQREQFKRLGVGGDWDDPYITFTPKYEVGILSVLRDLVAKGLVTKGRKTVHWDPVFRTALAEAEIEYHTHTSDSIYVAFPLRNAEKIEPLAGLGGAALVIWTTTPWTLPANVAVTLHPKFTYVALEAGGKRYIVARELAESFAKACGLGEFKILREFAAAPLERAECDHPIFPAGKSVVILGEHVTLDAGTGCVHTAPGHGHDDFVIGQKYGLPIPVPVDDRGCFTAEYPEMQGVSVFEANPKIIEKLRKSGRLLAAGKVEHEYPYSWRSNKPIIFRATEQWFMELAEGGVREKALDAIDNAIEWIPAWGRDRIRGMVEARPDWCLSRQRSWGVPIPAIRSKKEGKSILDTRIIDAFMKVVAEKGTDAWFTDPLESFWPKDFVHAATGESRPEEFEKEFDILDVWFDSGASHVAVLENDPRLSSPADLYIEGSDQHRGWFQSSLLTCIGARGRAPFKAVATHGFVMDGSGRAMHKSLGNVISPIDLMKKFGADILRLWVASEDYRSDVRVSDSILTQIAEAYRRIRNTFRFLIGNLHDFDPAKDALPREQLEETDRWILSRLAQVTEKVRRSYDAYDFHRVSREIHTFCDGDLSAVYLDVVKDRLYCSAPDDPARRACQTALHRLLDSLVRLAAPILVFTADEVWEHMPGTKPRESVHLAEMPEADGAWRDEALEEKWARLLALRDEVGVALDEVRKAKTIGQSLDAALELRPRDAAEGEFLSENLALLKALFIVSEVRLGPPGGAEGDRRTSVAPSPLAKCERCWMRDPGIGADAEHPGLCPRCSGVMKRI